ncbi:Prolipoprotein diacylglyceryl transferase [Lachnospiraceae bacterium TWA4]|nr:Prolipoprotein diacylglyceryl transferase [Lachnospiraceae bacterium TWA4]
MDLAFPNLGIKIEHLVQGITLPIAGGFEIKFYGIIIALGVLAGYSIACYCAKREGISSEVVLDFLIYALIFSIIGARLYYVIFSWDYYSQNPSQILNLRGGGLAIYGGVIGGVTTLIVYTRIKKLPFFKFADCFVPGLILGQAIGRWGNFFNCEAFGDYTNGPLAMQIKASLVHSSDITNKMLEHLVTINGESYIQVHPTFLYESLWNLGVLIVLLICTRHKKFNGEIFFLYLVCYGLGRVWIEGLRTDQLLLPGIGLPVSQILSGILIVFSVIMMIIFSKKNMDS